MIDYNVLSSVASNEIIGDDDLFRVENFDPEEKIVVDKKVGDRVKFKKDEGLGLDDYSIGLWAD